MTISQYELNPYIKSLDLNGVLVETNSFSLDMEVWATFNFESLEKYIDEVKKGTPEAVYVGFYQLIKNKTYTYQYFLREILFKTKTKIKENNAMIAEHLAEVMTAAQPIVKNPNRAKELNEALGKTENPEIDNYALYFDKVARRYGYTIEQYYALTSRQIHAIFKAIDIEDYKNLELQAALNGRKLKEQIKYHDFTPEEEKVHEEQAYAAMERLKERNK